MSRRTALLFSVILWVSGTVMAAPDPCAGARDWRKALCEFTSNNLVHSAWGFAHSKRDYLLASELARKEGLAVDDDTLFAAAMLHDMGGFAPYALATVDHALRSTQVVDTVLKPSGFPMNKADAVKKAILTHSYYCPDRPETSEALALHDADTLDFMGDIGVARILSIVGRETVTPDLPSAVKLLKGFEGTLLAKVYGGTYAKQLAQERTREMGVFLKTLSAESSHSRDL